MPRNTLFGGQERPDVLPAPGGAPTAPSTEAEAEAIHADTLFEVMVDTFGPGGTDSDGNGLPQFIRGDLITKADAKGCDLGWAEKVGSIRRAPEYADRRVESTTQPVDESGKVQASENMAPPERTRSK